MNLFTIEFQQPTGYCITRPNLKIDNKLKTKRDKASIVGGIFCGDIRHELNFEF